MGEEAAHAVGVHGHVDRVVAEGQVGVVVELVLDLRDVHDEGRGREVVGQAVGAGESVIGHAPSGQLGETVLDLLLGQRLHGHDQVLSL